VFAGVEGGFDFGGRAWADVRGEGRGGGPGRICYRGRSRIASGIFLAVADDVVADRSRRGLPGDLLPGLFRGWHAELMAKPY
jgi:hypothetical protein